MFILVLLASLLFHRFDMPRAHGDCKFRDEWLVQDKLYKEWVVKNGDPRIERCQFCMKSAIIHHERHDHHSIQAMPTPE